jgi:hypothetical protein
MITPKLAKSKMYRPTLDEQTIYIDFRLKTGALSEFVSIVTRKVTVDGIGLSTGFIGLQCTHFTTQHKAGNGSSACNQLC